MSETGRSITQQAYERLRADVLACRLPPGSRLRINDLCSELNVSLGAVREALSRLTSEGLVIAEPQRGFRVTEISKAELKDLTAVRIDIEVKCLARAIKVGDLAWESRLVAAYHELSRTPERTPDDSQRLNDAWSRLHRNYHEALVCACDSPWLLRIRSMLYAQSERYRRLSVPLARTTRNIDKEHRAILNAVVARNTRKACSLLMSHIGKTTKILLESNPADQVSRSGRDNGARLAKYALR
jgi:DNA-binding GntR family transcriptional regulator